MLVWHSYELYTGTFDWHTTHICVYTHHHRTIVHIALVARNMHRSCALLFHFRALTHIHLMLSNCLSVPNILARINEYAWNGFRFIPCRWWIFVRIRVFAVQSHHIAKLQINYLWIRLSWHIVKAAHYSVISEKDGMPFMVGGGGGVSRIFQTAKME